jgi:uncharacterized protein (UPF0335 family)
MTSEDISKMSDLSPEARNFVSRVLRIEKEKSHMTLPRGVYDELESALKEVVNE